MGPGPLLWCSTLLTAAALAHSAVRHRELMIKPSFIVVLFFHLQVQWASTLMHEEVSAALRSPAEFLLLCHAFPVLGLAGSLLIARGSTRLAWERIRLIAGLRPCTDRVAMTILAGIGLAIVAWYLEEVPFTETGLWTTLVNPSQSDLARELGWKLLPNRLLAYAVAILNASIAPLLASLLVLWILQARHEGDTRSVGIAVAAFCAVLIVVSLPGTRIAAARIVVIAALTVLLLRGYPLRLHYYVGLLAAVLVLAASMSVIRNSAELNASNLRKWVFEQGSLHRMFVDPMRGAVLYFQYKEQFGLFGTAAIPRLAPLTGQQPVDAPNVIARLLTGARIESESAVTSFVFAYFAYFGWWSFALSLAGLFLLDAIVRFYLLLSPPLLVATVTAITVTSIQFIESEYTAVFLTHGFAVIPLLALALAMFSQAWNRGDFKRDRLEAPGS